MKSSIFITARTDSKRLPKKAIVPVFGELRAIEFLIRRMLNSLEADSIILCTTTGSEDDILCDIATSQGIHYFRGSTEDKLIRWRDAALEFEVDCFVTADGDDLLSDPRLADAAINELRNDSIDLISAPEAPCGSFTYGIRTESLVQVCALKGTSDTEMMWVFFDLLQGVRRGQLALQESLRRPDIRLTLDYVEDLLFFREVISYFDGDPNVSTGEIIKLLDRRPELRAINQFRQQDYLDNQAKVIAKISPKGA